MVLLPSGNGGRPTDPYDLRTGELFTWLPVSYVNSVRQWREGQGVRWGSGRGCGRGCGYGCDIDVTLIGCRTYHKAAPWP
jgi:hypothetical protein